MASRSLAPFLRHLRDITRPAPAAGVGDGELVERFVRQRDEAAFELLVWRHQRMVLGVCRRVLLDTHEAEDAFQAAFLALVRKAESLRRHPCVAGWLHKVAYHIALRARKRAARQATVSLEENAREVEDDPVAAAEQREVAAVLDEEMLRLPEKYRLPMVLCYLEGKTYAEAGRLLKMPLGTLSARLTRGRSLLRARLARRGIGISGSLLAALLGEQASSAAAPTLLVKTALALALDQSASSSIAALADGALRSMQVGKAKLAAGLLAGFLLTGMGVFLSAALVSPAAVKEAPPPAADNPKTARVDLYGDPLPAGARFRFGSVRMRHLPAIRGSALSPNGKLLATTSGPYVLLWDLATGKIVHRLDSEHPGYFINPELAFSPDGRLLGCVQSDDFACIWEVKSGKRIAEFSGGRRNQSLCRFTPDGKQFVFNRAKQVIFWDMRANKETRAIDSEAVFLLTPDARIGVRFDRTPGLRFIDMLSGKETDRLDVRARHNGIENGVAFTPDGKALAIVHQNKEIQVRTFPGGKRLFTTPLPASAKRATSGDYWEYQLSFADRRTLLLGTSGGFIHRWDIENGKELPALQKHMGAVSGMHAAPDGQTLVTTGADGVIRRWDSRTGRELSEPPGYMGRTHAVYSSDGHYVVVGDARGRLELWDARNGRSLRLLQREGPAITRMAITGQGSLLAAARADNTVHFWTLPDGKEPRVLRCGEDNNLAHVWNMYFSPDGRRLLIADGRYRACLWELATGKVCWRERFGSAAFSPDGESLAMAYAGPYLTLLDAVSGRPRARLRLNTNTPELLAGVPAMAYSPDGTQLALGVDGVYLCSARTGAPLHHFQAADLPKGIRNDEVIRLRLQGDSVRGLAYSPDGRWLGTCGRDGSVRLWETATGQEVLRFDGHAGDVKNIAFGSDSRTLLSCGEDSQAYLWSLRPPGQREPKASLESLWSALAGEPAKAYRAIWAFSEDAESAAFLRGKLTPVKPVAEKRLIQLIEELESDTFAERERATKALAELGEMAIPAMRKKLTGKPPLETRKRLEELIRRIEARTWTVEDLRTQRAIDVLERLGTAEAREVLKALAADAPGARTTTAAQTALKRWGK